MLAFPVKLPVGIEQVARAPAEHAVQEAGVEVLDDHVEPLKDIVDEQPAERLARREQAHPIEQGHRRLLADERGVLPDVVEDERLQAEECLTCRIPFEVHEQAKLYWVAAARPP
jgi:hypothetical protein